MIADTLINKLVGERAKVEYDRYFMTMICLTATVFLLLLCIFHIIMGLKLAPVILAGSSSVILLGLYLLVRFGTCLFIPKIIVSIIGLFLLDLTWYSKFLSLGPVLFFIFAFGALIVWVWDNKPLTIMLFIYFLNLLILFLVEYTSADFQFQYESLKARTTDIYISFFLYSILLIFILTRVKNDFRIQKEKAIRSDKLKTAFLANLSHEIRTPMNSIVGFSNLIAQCPDKKTINKYVGNIQHSSESLLRLINEIINLSKIEAGYSDIQYSDFRIASLFKELLEMFLIELDRREKTNVRIDFEIPDDEQVIHSDFIILSQILSILLNNAIKFSRDGLILFTFKTDNNEMIFSVSDEGPGIPLENQKIVFDRFTKFDYNGVNTEGSGIGLSIAKKLVELLDGKIWLISEVGSGATFRFSIPFIEPKTKITQIIVPEKADNVKNEKPMHTDQEQIVLVVEDDRSSYLLIREILQPLRLNIHNVTDGRDAIDFVEQNPGTSLILMDLKLPFMDGYEATKKIKTLKPEIKIIAQTAYAMQGDKERAIAAGCDDYMSKPLDTVELQGLVKKYLSN